MTGHIVINPADNVAVVLEPGGVIPMGHKYALRDIAKGGDVVKYGFPIGRATEDIPAGSHVHIHNLATKLQGEIAYTYAPSFFPLPSPRGGVFSGFARASGEAGIRNEIWILPTVGCVNGLCGRIAEDARRRYEGGKFDGVYCFPHPYGCSQMGEDQTATQKILAGLATHPNAGGTLIVGLGCENNNLAFFKTALPDYDHERVRFLSAQESDNEIEDALRLLDELVALCERDTRRTFPASALAAGLKCGGSDGLSGVTANPLLGVFSDMLLADGGTTVLTEVPEMFGAETLLFNRCADQAVFNDAVSMINAFKRYYQRHNQTIYENPSPGNKDGGITTLEDKSLGCVQKGGRGTVRRVLRYGDRILGGGLCLLEGPGNDLVAVTALAAAHAQLILFTTGRGTPLGSPVPVIKIATNSVLARKKERWIDFNAGALLEGKTMDELAGALFDAVLKTASGELRTKNEEYGYRDMAIFKNGVTL